MRLTDHIALVGSSRFGLSNPFDCSIYALDCGEDIVLIDAGCGLEPELIEANLRDDGFDPARIGALVLTHAHADHAGGARVWKERTGCQIVAPEGLRSELQGTVDVSAVLETAKQAGIYPMDYTFPKVQVDVGVRDGDVLAFGDCRLHALEVAGHTTYHTCYWIELDGRRVLFSGDAVFYSGSVLLLNVPGCSLDDYRRDIGKLAGLEIDALLPGHGIFVMRYGQEHLNRAIEALRQLGVPNNFGGQCPKIIPEAYRRNT
jgi:glyoxylase-like metal-dependent hydrolase (beta-lactamase superfamily II)